jgi:hypothetical protein
MPSKDSENIAFPLHEDDSNPTYTRLVASAKVDLQIQDGSNKFDDLVYAPSQSGFLAAKEEDFLDRLPSQIFNHSTVEYTSPFGLLDFGFSDFVNQGDTEFFDSAVVIDSPLHHNRKPSQNVQECQTRGDSNAFSFRKARQFEVAGNLEFSAQYFHDPFAELVDIEMSLTDPIPLETIPTYVPQTTGHLPDALSPKLSFGLLESEFRENGGLGLICSTVKLWSIIMTDLRSLLQTELLRRRLSHLNWSNRISDPRTLCFCLENCGARKLDIFAFFPTFVWTATRHCIVPSVRARLWVMLPINQTPTSP